MENNLDKQDIQEVKLINEIIEQNPVIKRKYVKHKEPKKTKVCTICKIEKPLEQMVINETLGLERPVKMKNKCLDCYRVKSKDYYRDNKDKVLESIKKKYIENKKKYSVIVKFNDVTELTNEYNKLKDKLENNQMTEIKQRTYIPKLVKAAEACKKKSGDGGGNNSPANESV